MKENFYHGILLGLLGFKESWGIFSNRESGDGYSDIIVEIDDEETGIIIEVKYSDNGELETESRRHSILPHWQLPPSIVILRPSRNTSGRTDIRPFPWAANTRRT